jgi:hypothetical protein
MTSQPVPEELFHYTSAAGVLGILHKGSVWASMLHYMNDGQEFGYALELTRELLQRQLGNTEDDSECKKTCEEYLTTIERLAVFIFSLSEQRDLLSQWRAYCPPEGGYAVGFRTKELEEIGRPEGFRLVACEYDRDRQIGLLRPVVDQMISTARKLGPAASGIALHRVMTDEFAEVAARLKHPSFEEESEWRLVATRKSFETALSRATLTLIVPYFNLSITTQKGVPVSRVVVGPHRFPELARRSLHFMSAVDRGWPITVEHSKTPYRVIG